VEARADDEPSQSPADMSELVVHGMEHAVMVELVRYLYSDRVTPDLDDRLLVLLCVAAQRLRLTRCSISLAAWWVLIDD
jgi:hypothetical protein